MLVAESTLPIGKTSAAPRSPAGLRQSCSLITLSRGATRSNAQPTRLGEVCATHESVRRLPRFLHGLVASEMGVLILPKSAAELGIKDVAVRPLAGRWPQSELGVATLRSSADEPRLRKFLTTAVQLQPGSARSVEKSDHSSSFVLLDGIHLNSVNSL